MGKYIYRLTGLGSADFFDDGGAMLTDAATKLGILVCDDLSHLPANRNFGLEVALNSLNRLELTIDCPFEIYSRWARGDQFLTISSQGFHERLLGLARGQKRRYVHAETGCGADQTRAANMHILNGAGNLIHRRKVFNHKFVG
jgi:hypothetical protein